MILFFLMSIVYEPGPAPLHPLAKAEMQRSINTAATSWAIREVTSHGFFQIGPNTHLWHQSLMSGLNEGYHREDIQLKFESRAESDDFDIIAEEQGRGRLTLLADDLRRLNPNCTLFSDLIANRDGTLNFDHGTARVRGMTHGLTPEQLSNLPGFGVRRFLTHLIFDTIHVPVEDTPTGEALVAEYTQYGAGVLHLRSRREIQIYDGIIFNSRSRQLVPRNISLEQATI